MTLSTIGSRSFPNCQPLAEMLSGLRHAYKVTTSVVCGFYLKVLV